MSAISKKYDCQARASGYSEPSALQPLPWYSQAAPLQRIPGRSASQAPTSKESKGSQIVAGTQPSSRLPTTRAGTPAGTTERAAQSLSAGLA
jgi:hypothetical protein